MSSGCSIHSFDDTFKYDENRRPRVWKPTDDIDKVYDLARQRTEEMLNLFRVDAVDFGTMGLTIDNRAAGLLTPARRDTVWELVSRDCEAAYNEAQHARMGVRPAGAMDRASRQVP